MGLSYVCLKLRDSLRRPLLEPRHHGVKVRSHQLPAFRATPPPESSLSGVTDATNFGAGGGGSGAGADSGTGSGSGFGSGACGAGGSATTGSATTGSASGGGMNCFGGGGGS